MKLSKQLLITSLAAGAIFTSTTFAGTLVQTLTAKTESIQVLTKVLSNGKVIRCESAGSYCVSNSDCCDSPCLSNHCAWMQSK